MYAPDDALENDAWCEICAGQGERVAAFAFQDEIALCREHYRRRMFSPEHEQQEITPAEHSEALEPSRHGMKGPLAGIDIGTNTVRLLVVEPQPDESWPDESWPDESWPGESWKVVDQARRITRLGEGANHNRGLHPAAIQRTIAAVKEFTDRARRAGATRINAVATSAVREAPNQAEFLEAAWQQARLPVRIIDGEEEARLTVAGVQRAVGCHDGLSLVVDIGGGSTEFSLTRATEIVASESCLLGVVTLTERYLTQAPTDRNEYAALIKAIDAELARIEAALQPRQATRLVGTAGTITSLVALDLGLEPYDSAAVNNASLSLRRARELLDGLCGLSLEQRRAIPSLEEGREDIIVSGAALVVRMMERFAFDELLVSDYGLREGLICALLAPRVNAGASRQASKERFGEA